MPPAAARAMGWARIGGLITLALLTVFSLLLGYCLIYPNTLKPLAESITEWALERPLEINGDLSLSLSMTPTVSVTDARLGNTADGVAPYMVSAGFAQAQIDLAALFDYRVHLLDLQVRSAELHLEDQMDRPPNWQFFEAEQDGGEENPWSFMIQQLQVTDSHVYAAIGELAPMVLSIPFLEEASDPQNHLNLNGHGELNGDPWRLRGRIGPFSEILAAGQIELNLELMVDDAEIEAQGTIGNLAALTKVDLALTIYGPDADLLGEIFRMPNSFAQDIALEAEVRPSATGHAMSVIGHISDFDIETVGTITNLAALDGWDGTTRISGPDLGVFGKVLQIEGFPDGKFELQGTLHLHGGDLDLLDVAIRTEDVTLNLDADFEQFPKREGAVGSIRLSGNDISEFRELLHLPGLPAVPFNVSLTLNTSGTEILSSTVTVGGHTLDAAGTVGDFSDFHGTELQARARGEDIATLLQAFEINQPLTGPYEATTRLTIDADGLNLRHSSLRMAGHAVEGDLRWPELSRMDSLEFRGSITLDNLAETGIQFGISGLPAHPLTGDGLLTIDEDQLVLEKSQTRFRSLEMSAHGRLGLPAGLSELDLNIEIEGPRASELFTDVIAIPDGPTPFKLALSLRGREEALELRAFTLETPGGLFNTQGIVALTPGWAGSQLTLEGSGSELNMILPAFPNYIPPEASWQLSAYVELTSPDHLLIRNGQLEVGSVELKLDGMLDAEDQTRTNLTFSASGDRVRDIGQIGQIPWPDHPFEITADLEGTMNTLQINALEARWGDSDLTGGGSVFFTDRLFFEVQGRSNLLDIYDLQHAVFGAPEDLEPEDDAHKMFSDAPIPMRLFAEFDALIDVQVDRFRGQRARLEDISLELKIEDGELILNRAAYRDESGYFDAAGLLRPEGDNVYVELALAGEEVDFGLLTSEGQQQDSLPRYSLDVDIWGHGQTIAQLAAGLNGRLLVSSNGGQINNGLVEALGGDFLSNVLETLNPFVETEAFTQMDCLVLNAAINNGRLKMEPGFVMRTDRLNMFVYGNVDLEQERLDLSLATQARRGIGISASTITNPYFKIGGTLASPALELDPASAAIAASVATATAGLSILIRGVFERLLGTQNPCPNFLKYEQISPEKPDAMANPVPAA